VNLRRDLAAGGAFVVAGALIWAVSGDLPFGTLASPGAGMLPKLVIALMMGFGLVIALRARESPPLSDLPWSDLPHAVRVVAVSAVAVALYVELGFLLTVSLMLFTLTCLVERRPLPNAVLFSLGVTGLVYLSFHVGLKLPLPRGPLGF
jgi:hypothetical protein